MGRTTLVTMIATLSLVAPLKSMTALELELTQKSGDETVISIERIIRKGNGFEATVESSLGEIDRLVMDDAYSTIEWSRSFPKEGTEVKGRREGRFVSVAGTFKNQAFSLRKDFGDLPWFQFQELSYPALRERTGPQAEFWTIGRADLKPTRFRSELQATETITIMGKPVQALHYYLTVHNVPALLFRSSFWLRKTDGVFLRLSVPPVLGLAATQVEITAEKP